MVQRVLITAGAAGIGREFARAFAANGGKVFVCDIDEGALAALAKEIPGLIARRCDMSQRAEIEAMVPAAVEALGGLDVLINNAGIAGLTLPVEQYPADDWDKVVAVNLTAMFDVTRLAIPHLKQSKAGCIVNMTSIAGRYGFANRSPYAATKWGVIGFTKTLAIELGEWGIRANAIAPGAVAGERIVRVFQGRAQISGKSMEEVKAAAMAEQSIKDMIDPKDIARSRCFSPPTPASRFPARCCRSTMTGSGRESLLPARFSVAGAGFGRVDFLPRGDRQRFVVVHLVDHAGAIFQLDRRARVHAGAVGDAPVDPFHVVGGYGECGAGREQ